MRTLTAAERLIVAADYDAVILPEDREGDSRGRVRSQVMSLANNLAQTEVCLKANSALRALGYGLIDEVHRLGLRFFADLKIYDISETLAKDGRLLLEAKPEILTVSCNAGVSDPTR